MLHTPIRCIIRTLVRAGALVEDPEHPWLDFEPVGALEQLAGAAVRYRIAVGRVQDHDLRQHLIAEKFGPAIGQSSIYTTQADEALSTSESLTGGKRIGRLDTSDLGATEQMIFTAVTNVNMIDVQGVNSFCGHSYPRDSPAVSSDFILLLRDGELPGERGRPLEYVMIDYWRLRGDCPDTAP